MTNKYEDTNQVPDQVLLTRVAELVDAVTQGSAGLNEFTMRVPAECDRDADLVLTELIIRYRNLIERAEAAEKHLAEVEQEREVAYENWQKKYQYLKDSMTLTRCYECGTLVREVSPRSRCCMCEYGRATFNERDNEQLRQQLSGGE